MEILSDGTILNEGSLDKLQPIFKELVEESTNRILSGFKPLAIYLRGSLSDGKGIKSLSDIDLVVFIESKPNKNEKDKVLQIIDSLESDFSVVSEVDITLLNYDLLMSSEYKRLRVYLKTQSCLLYGNDVLSNIKDFKADKDLAHFMYSNIKTELSDLHSYFKGYGSRSYLSRVRKPRFWCRWTMRTILRSGLGLVMYKKPVYTPNLHTCAKILSEEFPDLAVDIKKILEYEMDPINNKDQIRLFLDNFLPKYFPLWDNVLKIFRTNR